MGAAFTQVAGPFPGNQLTRADPCASERLLPAARNPETTSLCCSTCC